MDEQTVAYGATPPDEPPEPGRDGAKLLVGALVLAVALAATFAALWLTERDTSPQDVTALLSSRSDAVESRVSEVLDLLTNYDATNLDEVAERMLEISTGDFREDYEESFAAGLGSALEEVSASSRGQVLDGPDVSFRTASEAIAVARVTQTVQNNANPTGRSIEYVMEITLIDTDSGWKADRVEVLSTEEL
ncbi:MAG: hypothetical protein ACRDJI_06360 [Actinomycetota bacterium]